MTVQKEQVLHQLRNNAIVAVIRGNTPEHALQLAEACLAGGILSLEIAYTTPAAHRVIETLATKHENACVGAGTVLDAETARISMLSGAKYIVSPYFDEDTMRMCNRYRIPCLPGAMTIHDIVRALEFGADIVKLFPGELHGPAFIKAVKGPLPQAQLMPTGGVNLDNVEDWFEAGAVALGVGGALTGGSEPGDYSVIESRAKQFIQKAETFRQNAKS